MIGRRRGGQGCRYGREEGGGRDRVTHKLKCIFCLVPLFFRIVDSPNIPEYLPSNHHRLVEDDILYNFQDI